MDTEACAHHSTTFCIETATPLEVKTAYTSKQICIHQVAEALRFIANTNFANLRHFLSHAREYASSEERLASRVSQVEKKIRACELGRPISPVEDSIIQNIERLQSDLERATGEFEEKVAEKQALWEILNPLRKKIKHKGGSTRKEAAKKKELQRRELTNQIGALKVKIQQLSASLDSEKGRLISRQIRQKDSGQRIPDLLGRLERYQGERDETQHRVQALMATFFQGFSQEEFRCCIELTGLVVRMEDLFVKGTKGS